MKIKEVILTLEQFAPLPLQESYDNAGLQLGFTDVELSGVLLCLDVTEAVIDEAIENNCNLIVAHHPLLFRGLKQILNEKYVERCVRKAIKNDITIYASHTNLDNAENGLNFIFAEKMSLNVEQFLTDENEVAGVKGGSGILTSFNKAIDANDFLNLLQEKFSIECIEHNETLCRKIKKVAICTGAGDFLLDKALEAEADAFITGEMHYHQYFGLEQKIQIAVLGHYQSEKIVKKLFKRILASAIDNTLIYTSKLNTNPINYKYGH